MHKIQCKDTFENCEKKVTEVINKLGMTLFAIIDHSRNAERWIRASVRGSSFFSVIQA